MAALAALLATAWGRTAALMWAAAVIAIAGGAAWWASMAWRRVTVEAWFEPARAFIGEPTFLAIRVANAKPRALPIVRISVRLPEGLDQVPDPEPTAFHGHRQRTQVDGDAEVCCGSRSTRSTGASSGSIAWTSSCPIRSTWRRCAARSPSSARCS